MVYTSAFFCNHLYIFIKMIRFGKYKDQSLKDIYEKDSNYLEWLSTQPWYKIKFESLYYTKI